MQLHYRESQGWDQDGLDGFVRAMERVSRVLRDPAAGRQAVTRRVRKLAATVLGRKGAGSAAAAGDLNRCLVCGSAKTRVREIERPKRTYEIRVCQSCKYVSNFANTVDYTKFQSVERFALTPRVGTAERPGREYYMAVMGADILRRSSLRVMVFGAGRSLDYQHIAKLPSVERVVMSDVVDLRGEADFINITKGTSQRFDLIIACEVVEHFTDPRTEFPRLFDLLTKDGLLVCSTNIRDGKKLETLNYLYLRGHTSYYSAKAIAEIARANRMLFDFRLPSIARSTGGRRKRYVLFTRSVDNLANIAEYFGRHAFAPSEPPGRPASASAAEAAPPAKVEARAGDAKEAAG
jgi:SAM-dependent methyltransferase